MIGIDAVDVERLRLVLGRSKGTEGRLFTLVERNYCRTKFDPVTHFAGTLAVKEAVIKAARLGALTAWGRRIEVQRDTSGVPRVAIAGMPEMRFDISISHDGPVAVAVAIARGTTSPAKAAREVRADDLSLRPNEQLARYLARLDLGPSKAPSTSVPDRTLHHVSSSWAGTDFP
jgi:holo-[acyl-carrier protein] synthase